MSIEQINPMKINWTVLEEQPEFCQLLSYIHTQIGHMNELLDRSMTPSTDEDLPIFTPSLTDARLRIHQFLLQRRGQARFRERLLTRYDRRCPLSGCRIEELLEAAHIWPYRGPSDNHLTNGLLLRADLHTLFDVDLLGFEPTTLIAHLHPKARTHGYAEFEGKKLEDLCSRTVMNSAALLYRWECFQARLNQTNRLDLSLQIPFPAPSNDHSLVQVAGSLTRAAGANLGQL
jgi:putative restriction endonuclease